MKKSSIIKICSAVIVIVVILVGIILFQSESSSVPNYEFLKNPKPFVETTQLYKSKFGAREIKTYLDFETDYNDFSARASAELTKLGFKIRKSLTHSIFEDYMNPQPIEWYYKDSSCSIDVLIYLNYKLSKEEKNLQKLHTGSIYAQDCVTVYITQSQKENLLIRKLRLLLNKLRN